MSAVGIVRATQHRTGSLRKSAGSYDAPFFNAASSESLGTPRIA